jgi:uncharacterized protein (TIGR02145 family)
MKISKIILYFLLSSLMFLTSCKKIEKEMMVSTGAVTDITMTSAIVSGQILDLGEGASNFGHCYATAPNPTIANMKTELGSPSGKNIFVSNLTDLIRDTKYYVKAYLKRGDEVVYGSEVNFTTISDTPPVLSTSSVMEISQTSAICGGNITSPGGTDIISRGVCWSTSTNPTIDDNKTIDGTGIGGFASSITGLTPNTIYYTKAYATNNAYTSYGNIQSFTTLSSIEGAIISAFTATTVTCTGNITPGGGASIQAKGACWNTSGNPTISDNKTTDGIGTGVFTSNLTNLLPNTKYYIRLYSTNGGGTAYSNQLTLTTDPSTITDACGNSYNIVRIGTQLWTKENLKTTKFNDGNDIPNITDNATWHDLTTPGYCWLNNNSSNKNVYGALYNWFTVITGKLCPSGWHVPNDSEWHMLIMYIDPNASLTESTESLIAGGKLKETGTSHWPSPNTGATNETNFTALPSGYRQIDGQFLSFPSAGYWWSSTQNTASWAWFRSIYYNNTQVFRAGTGYKQEGKSVRCVRN